MSNPIRISLFLERSTYETIKKLIGSHSVASSHLREAINRYVDMLEKSQTLKKG